MTGASSQFGKSIILDNKERFDRIIAHRLNGSENIDALREALGEKLMVVEADFSSEADTRRMVKELLDQGIVPTDIIHLPAGKFALKNFNKIPWIEYQSGMDIAVRSAVLILQEFLPEMAKAHEGRVIVMLSSVTAGNPPKYLSYYVMVKYALLGLIKGLSSEYAGKNISINGVSPEMADTSYLRDVPTVVREMNAKSSPRGRLLVPEDVLPVFRMLLSKDAMAITGQNILITDGK